MSESQNRVWIKKIEITNCGRYYEGPHTLDFTDPAEKNITIIMGDSGTGKSTIHDLIYWCMYGEFKPVRKTKTEENEADYGLLNTDKLESLQIGEEVTGTITLTIHNENGELYYLSRSLTAKYNKELTGRIFNSKNNSDVRKGTEFYKQQQMMYRNESGNREPTEDKFIIKNRINAIFPQQLSDFFLFDGEELDKFEQTSTSTDYVKQGIEKISGLNVLDELKETCISTSESLFDYVNGKSASTSGLNNTYQEQKKACMTLQETIDKEKVILAEKKKILEQYIIRLVKVTDGRKFEKKLEEEKKIKKQLEKDVVKTRHNLHELMFKNIPNLLGKETFQNCEVIFRKLEDDDKIPPAISRKAIDKILTSDPLRCVCGRDLEKDDEWWGNLQNIKKGIINEKALNLLVDGADLIGRMLTTVMDKNSISDDLDELIESRYDKGKLIESQEGKILEIEKDVVTIEDDKGEDIGKKKTDLSEEIGVLENSIRNNGYQLEDKITKRDRTSSELKKKTQKANEYAIQNHKIDILNAITEFVVERRKVIVEKLREETEASTNKYFKKSVAQAKSFNKLLISPKFEITARDDRGLIAGVSKGQGHVLGLSYVAGVRDISDVKTSLIIDSPLHNISSKSRNKMAQALAENLPGVQLILLVTDTEYTQSIGTADAVQNIMKPLGNVSKEYQIMEKEIDDPNEPGKKIHAREFVEL
jgi:DNA sulfur modification protein DndD